MIELKWIVKIHWSGNLQNVPLPGETTIKNYKQIQPGLIDVDILCTDRADLILLLAEVTENLWCSKFHADPYFGKD